MSKRLWIPLVLTVLTVLTVSAWRFGAGDVVPTGTLSLRFTGESLGRLDACVCDGRLAGGLVFRRGYLESAPPALLLDTGNAACGSGDLELLRAEEVLKAMNEMGVAAMNLGESELALGLDPLRRLAKQQVPLVSLNVSAADAPWQPAIVQTYGGEAILVAGVVDEHFVAGRDLQVRPAREAIAAWVESERRPGLRCILADLTRPQVRAIAEEFPEIDLILFRGRNESHPPERINRTWIASVYGSRYIAELTLTRQGRALAVTGKAVELLEEVAGSARRSSAPAGVTVEPQQLPFGTFTKGENHRATLRIKNANAHPVTLGRVFSPCTCFVLALPETVVPAGGEVPIEVNLHSLELSGEVKFNLFVEIRGETPGILTVPATATVQERVE